MIFSILQISAGEQPQKLSLANTFSAGILCKVKVEKLSRINGFLGQHFKKPKHWGGGCFRMAAVQTQTEKLPSSALNVLA